MARASTPSSATCRPSTNMNRGRGDRARLMTLRNPSAVGTTPNRSVNVYSSAVQVSGSPMILHPRQLDLETCGPIACTCSKSKEDTVSRCNKGWGLLSWAGACRSRPQRRSSRRISMPAKRKAKSSSMARLYRKADGRSPSGFQKKYGIDVEYWRGSSTQASERALTDGSAPAGPASTSPKAIAVSN